MDSQEQPRFVKKLTEAKFSRFTFFDLQYSKETKDESSKQN
jgi:hypothetical protein